MNDNKNLDPELEFNAEQDPANNAEPQEQQSDASDDQFAQVQSNLAIDYVEEDPNNPTALALSIPVDATIGDEADSHAELSTNDLDELDDLSEDQLSWDALSSAPMPDLLQAERTEQVDSSDLAQTLGHADRSETADTAEATGVSEATKNTNLAESAENAPTRVVSESAQPTSVHLAQNPVLEFDHVSVADHNHRLILDNFSLQCFAGSLVRVAQSSAQCTAIMALAGRLLAPQQGKVLLKSRDIAQLDNPKVRGHLVALWPREHAIRLDLNAVDAVVYAMKASRRNFLKKPELIAEQLLAQVGISQESSRILVQDLSQYEQQLVTLARVLSCEPSVIVVDDLRQSLTPEQVEQILAQLTEYISSTEQKRTALYLEATN